MTFAVLLHDGSLHSPKPLSLKERGFAFFPPFDVTTTPKPTDYNKTGDALADFPFNQNRFAHPMAHARA